MKGNAVTSDDGDLTITITVPREQLARQGHDRILKNVQSIARGYVIAEQRRVKARG